MKPILCYFFVLLLLLGCQNESKLSFKTHSVETQTCADCPEISIVIPKALGSSKTANNTHHNTYKRSSIGSTPPQDAASTGQPLKPSAIKL